ncbi:MAG: hypothetical protein V2I56_03985 [Desulfobacteraceae bacterium]|jgi:hypothetical protein|nr:hypothetical protein [Desulfobacteraceae bacterium]
MTTNVLFIGNSHTYLNFMPRMLLALVNAADRGFELMVDQCTGEGASLGWHWKNPPSRAAITGNRWDYVVLQDRSAGPLEEPESFEHHAGLLDSEIRKQEARTILYMTWANRTRPESQAALAKIYARMAQGLGAILAPVGLAWEAVYRIEPDFDLHHRDGRHANPAGSYLTACVFYSILFNTSPEGLPGTFYHNGKMRLDLDKDQALLLQRVAWETVSSISDFRFRISD